MGKSAGVVVLVVGLIAGVALAKVLGGDGDGAGPGQIPETITVSGTATVSSAPDQAILNLGVRSDGETAEEAFAAKAERTDAVFAELKAAGVSDDDIATTDLRLNKRVADRNTPKERTYFTAETEFDVTIRELNDAGEIAARAVGAGANVVGGIEFRLGNQTGAREEALTEAIEGARGKAEAMATAADAEVGEVILIDETNAEFQPYRQQLANQGMLLAGASSDSYEEFKISPGDVETRVTVTVVYELDD
ncbi:MAG: SIMPL domain-containing protein [Actinomycetota bacterium]